MAGLKSPPQLFRHRCRFIQSLIEEQQAELFAPETSDQIGRPGIASQDRRDALEDFVAHRVAVFVVHRFEEVDVDHHAGNGQAVPLGFDPKVFKLREERTAVHAPGQRVGGGQAFEFFVLLTNLISRFVKLIDDEVQFAFLLFERRDILQTGEHALTDLFFIENGGRVDDKRPTLFVIDL